MSNDLRDASALEQARLVRDGKLSSEELTRFYLERIAEKNEGLQAFVTVFGRRALIAAKRKDTERARSRDRASLPPFHGVPIGIKDLNGLRMAPRRLGSRAFKYLYWPVDDPSVAQIRAGGFVFLGKLATSELGAMPVTETDIHPPTRNPWDTRFTSGGSSGGSGAAVAAGLIPLAHGSDGAGSIRIPSSFCHLFGIKPSRDRVPNIIEHGDDAITTCGPLARNVDDAAAMLDVQAGLSSGKPTAAPRPEARFLELANREPPKLRIRFTLESPLCKTDPEIADTVRKVLRTLEGLGHTVEPGSKVEGTLEEFLPVWQHLVAATPVLRPGLLQPITRWLVEAGKKLDPATVRSRRRLLARRVFDGFGDADVYVSPTVAVPPPEIGAWRSLLPEEGFEKAAELGAFTAVFNLSGQPAVSIPAGVSRAGLPMGVQLAGRMYDEGLVLAVAKQLEKAMPWSSRKAPTW